MNESSKQRKRAYHAPQRIAQAQRTREAIVQAARQLFESSGWAGTTVSSIGETAGVSQKTVEALFGTKSALLQAAVDYAIRGDFETEPIVQRESVQRMEAAPDAATMLRLHARHLRTINGRSARIAWTVEHAAPSDRSVRKLWQRMNENRAYAVRWATDTLLTKPGRKPRLARKEVENTFWVALDWGTYRTLTEQAHLAPDGYERWLRRYYAATLLPPPSPDRSTTVTAS